MDQNTEKRIENPYIPMAFEADGMLRWVSEKGHLVGLQVQRHHAIQFRSFLALQPLRHSLG